MQTSQTTALAKPIFVEVGSRRYQVGSLREASEMFCAARDAMGEGASNTPGCRVVHEDGSEVTRISYNGRVWPAGEWKPDARPLYDNRVA